MSELDQLLQEAMQNIAHAENLQNLDHFRVHYLGKKGKLTEYLKNVGQLPPAERPLLGQKINFAKQQIQALIDQKIVTLQKSLVEKKLAEEALDVTLPGRHQSLGSNHPITKTREEVERLFLQAGFTIAEGPEIEDDYHNFAALNIPPFHPARAMQDTFYFKDNTLLRTQTSNVQIRVMKNTPPPLRIIAIGRVYRRDFDLTHTPMFHQMEGFIVDEGVNFAELKGMLSQFLHAFFDENIGIRFRPSYFPFTEPSAEVDISCLNCKSHGCRICKNTGWLEVLGCGMVHPHVFQSVGIDSEKYTGWAFGCGLDRLALLRFGISDLRSMFENDLRFLRQFT